MTKPALIDAELREVYWVPRDLLDPADPKPGRPVVVIEAPAGPAGRVRVVSRTRYEPRGGVESPAGGDPRFSDKGWFSDEYTIDAAEFTNPPVTYQGLLEWALYDKVLEWFG